MTPVEIAAEIQNLRGQIVELQQQQDAQKKYWFRCGLIAMTIGLAMTIVSISISVATVAGPTRPIANILLFAAWLLYFLAIVFAYAGRRPTDTAWSLLKWAFSSDKLYPTASRPGA